MMACLAFCLAGCAIAPTGNSTGENRSPSAPQPVVATPAPVVTPTITVAKPVIPPPVKTPAPVRISPPPVISPYTNTSRAVNQFNQPPSIVTKSTSAAPVTTWTSLDHWAQENGIGAPRRLSSTPVVSYAIGSQHGVMVVYIGSHDATWNGTLLHLGFPPEIADDQIYVHSLDLEKNFAPLLCKTASLPELHHIIVIDPGHGGREPGANSAVDGRPEKAFTLDWARRLAPLLEARGWQVYLTRTNDADVGVTNRAAFAVAHGADLFISLHFNSSYPDHKQAGLETYCLAPTGMPSTITRGYPDILSRTFPANAYDQESLWLALRLQTSILRATGEEDRGVRRARFLGVLQGQHCPAVLIEGAYLSNPREADRIENGDYRQILAEAVANALR